MPADAHAEDPLLQLDPTRPYRWLFLDLNSYFASVEQQEDPRLRGRPVGIVPSAGENTCTIAASIEARRCGVRTGTPLREARRLCPGIVLRPARHALYVAYHHRVLAEVDRHVPVERVWSIDEVSVRLLGPQRRPAEALALARAIKAGLAARVGACIRCSIGLAPSRQLAKLATELQKPDGLVALGPDDLPAWLLALALRDFPGIGPRMAARLVRCGVVDAAGLWAMGPQRARLIWGGVQGERFWYGLRGADLPEPPLPATPHSLGHARVLPPGLRDLASARHVTRLLAMKATARLRAAGCLATVLGLEVEPAATVEVEPSATGLGVEPSATGLGVEPAAAGLGFPAMSRPWALGRLNGEVRLRQTDDERVVLAELDRLWAMLPTVGAKAPPARVWRVSVVLAGLVAVVQATPDLLDWAEAASRSAPRPGLGRAMDAVHRRFGRGSLIFGPAPLDWAAYAGAKVAFARLPEAKDAGVGSR